jgi:subtilisin family serine protease
VNGQDDRKDLLTRIAREQVGRISAEFKQQRGITVQVATADGAAYMYATDQILIKEDTFDQVHRSLREIVLTSHVEDVIPGIKLAHLAPAARFSRRPTVLDVLRRVDDEVGRGVAAPNHVLTVTPETGPCPATEPEEVYFDIEPSPGVRMDENSDGRGVRIYIADTGLLADTTSHWWLAGVQGGPDPLQPMPGDTIKPYAGHGTFVAGVTRTMARHADVYVSNVFKVAGSALETDLVQDLAAALEDGVDIFNLSITTPSRKDLELLGFAGWLTLLHEHPGVACVVAAGNDGLSHKFWPAAFPGMISVGALTADGRNRANFSNYGDWVKVYAPGRNLINAYATGTYVCQDPPYVGQSRDFYGMCQWSGTSFSTPMVTGLIAARMSRTGETGQQAAESLLIDAKSQAIPGVGDVLLPYGNAFPV